MVLSIPVTDHFTLLRWRMIAMIYLLLKHKNHADLELVMIDQSQ